MLWVPKRLGAASILIVLLSLASPIAAARQSATGPDCSRATTRAGGDAAHDAFRCVRVEERIEEPDRPTYSEPATRTVGKIVAGDDKSNCGQGSKTLRERLNGIP